MPKDKQTTREPKQKAPENVLIEPLSDEALEGVAGGCEINSASSGACDPGTGGG